jgi:hypothetical protein
VACVKTSIDKSAVDRSAKRFASIQQAFPCIDSLAIPVTAEPDLAARKCSLTRLAIHEIALGHLRAAGVLPEDSDQVFRSSASEMRFASLDGSPGQWIWTVELSLRNEPFHVAVQINELTDGIVAERAEQ